MVEKRDADCWTALMGVTLAETPRAAMTDAGVTAADVELVVVKTA